MSRTASHPRKSSAARSRSRSPIARAPGWLWLGTGLAAGLFLAFLYYLATSPRSPAEARGTPSQRAASGPSESVKFNFYTLLPEREDSRPSPTPQQATPKQSAPGKLDVEYYLQAGAFQKREQAERRRVELLLLNTDAQIKKISIDGRAWYRLQAGPYQSRGQVNGVQSKLQREGIETLLTTRKTS